MPISARLTAVCRFSLIVAWGACVLDLAPAVAQTTKPAGKSRVTLTRQSTGEAPTESEGPFLQGPALTYPEPVELEEEVAGPPRGARGGLNLAPRRRDTVAPNY